jgi:hypothetical protein
VAAPQLIAGDVLRAIGTGEFDVSHNRKRCRVFSDVAPLAGDKAASDASMYSTGPPSRQAKQSQYLLDPGLKNEFYRGCVSLKLYQTWFGNRIIS